MSYDIAIRTERPTGRTYGMVNPFTKQTQQVAEHSPITPAELSALLAVFARAGARGPDSAGGFVVEFADGGRACARPRTAPNGLHGYWLEIRGAGVTPTMAFFIWDLARAADLAIENEEGAIVRDAGVWQDVRAFLAGPSAQWVTARDWVMSGQATLHR